MSTKTTYGIRIVIIVLILIILEVLYETLKDALTTSATTGLNPYYTGSTLWVIRGLEEQLVELWS